jgi:hypothetical protein
VLFDRPAIKVGATSSGTNHADSISLPLLDRFGSVHAARLKQQGRRFPLFIFEMVTSTRRLRVSRFGVALIQRTHSHRAMGVMSSHTSWIFRGAAARAVSRSRGTFASGHSLSGSTSTVTLSPALRAALRFSFPSILIQWPKVPSGSNTVWKPWPLSVPRTATCPRDGSFRLAVSGKRTISDLPMVDSVASKRIVGTSARWLMVRHFALRLAWRRRAPYERSLARLRR